MQNGADAKVNKRGKAVPILGTVLAVLVIAMILALCLPNRKTAEFTPPPFEQNAVSGTPEVPEELGYSSPYQEGMAYRFSVCGNVTAENGEAVVYLTNAAENQVWLKVRILDENGEILGESGLVKPGEYVKSVALSTLPDAGTKISLKIMGYEPETYRSAGSVTLNTAMGGGTARLPRRSV